MLGLVGSVKGDRCIFDAKDACVSGYLCDLGGNLKLLRRTIRSLQGTWCLREDRYT